MKEHYSQKEIFTDRNCTSKGEEMVVFKRILCGALLLCLCASAAAENYKCKQADGSVAYQDTPCTATAVAQQVVNPATGSVLTLSMSEIGMIGIRRAVRRQSDQGSMPAAMAACFSGLGNDKLYSTFQSLLKENLSAADLREANTFFNSATGQKLARRNVLRVYTQLGETPPGPEPVLTAVEENAVSEFTATPAGQKLITQRFMTSSDSRPVVVARIQELYNECARQRR